MNTHWLWKVSILTAEFGHWLALGGMLIAAAVGWPWRARRRGLGGGLFLLGVSLLYLRPAAEGFALSGRWSRQLSPLVSASQVEARPWIRFSRLWRMGGPRAKARAIVYDEGHGLSLYFYPAAGPGPAPWVLVIHGGGWDSGAPGQFPALNGTLAAEGIAVADMAYRLAPWWTWPAAKADAESAAAYLKSHGRELGLDPGRWAILGHSAGGQIAESVAFAGFDPTLKGCIAFYAPADLNFAFIHAKDDKILDTKALLRAYLGGEPPAAKRKYDEASAIDSVGPESPPTLLFHGDMDPLTWNGQSRRLKERMDAAGARCAYLALPWATHGFDYNPNGPGGQISERAVLAFLSSVLLQKGNR